MAKINKSQAEAAYNVVCRKITEVRNNHRQEEIDNFHINYPEDYTVICNYSEYVNTLQDIYDNKNNYKVFSPTNFGKTSVEKIITNLIYRVLDKKYPFPNRSEFIDELLILGDTDIKEYINKFINKYE